MSSAPCGTRRAWLRELERLADELERRAPAWLGTLPLGIQPTTAPSWLLEAAREWGIVLEPGVAPRNAVERRFARRSAHLPAPESSPGAADADERAWRRRLRPERIADLARLDAAVAAFGTQSLPSAAGAELDYRHAGAGPATVVVWNALDQDALLLRGPLALLPRRWRVLTWQPRPAARAGDHDAPAFAEHEADLLRILAHEGLERVHLVGWCTGGKSCLRFAARHPQRVDSVALLQPALRDPATPAAADSPWEREMVHFAARLLEQPELAPLAAAALTRLDTGAVLTDARLREDPIACAEEALARVPSDVEPLVRRTWRDGASALAYLRRMADFWRHPVEDALASVACPVLVVSAGHDRVASPRLAERACRRMSAAMATTHWCAPDGDHYLPHQEPALAAAALEAFLARPTAPRPPHAELIPYSEAVQDGIPVA
jgi:pimeloyl-ACP methyl ester carboxylesterase